MWSKLCSSVCALGLLVVLGAGCTKKPDEGVANLVTRTSPGLSLPSGPLVGYIDVQKVVAAHPLHGELQSLQDQIAALNVQSQLVPKTTTPEQKAAQAALERELSSADLAFQQELARKRGFYEQQESAALQQLYGQALGGQAQGPGGLIGSMQQQFNEQVKTLGEQGRKTLDDYRSALFKADAEHLRQVQGRIADDVRAKVQERRSQLEANETAYQIDLAKKDQDQRLNLKTKLENLTLTDQERTQYTAQLQNIETNEENLINQLKQRDNNDLNDFQTQLQRQAAARFDEERANTEKETQAKLAARQHELESQLREQTKSLGGKFNSELASANRTLGANPKVRTQVQSIHTQMQSKYESEASQALASYRQTRKDLVAKYSAIAHMQFQDASAIAAQIDGLAAKRRDLYGRMLEQVQAQAQEVARRDGVAIVFASIAGAGTAVDLTEQVTKAVAALPSTTPAPSPSAGG